MSDINQVYINNLADFEYYMRDGMVFTEKQYNEIAEIAQRILLMAEQKIWVKG